LGAIRAVATAGEPGEFLFLFWSSKQRTISPIFRRPNFTKSEHNTLIGIAMNFDNFTAKVAFLKTHLKNH